MTATGPTEHLGYAIASWGERLWAFVASLCLVGLALLAFPYGARTVPAADALQPSLLSAAIITMLVSAAILRNQYRASSFPPFAFLATAYATTAALLIPYLVLLPHLYSPTTFGTGTQTAIWLWVAWHAAFILLLGAYLWSQSFFTRQEMAPHNSAAIVRGYVIAVIAVAEACALATIVFHDRLPVLVAHGTYSPLFHLLVEQLLLALSAVVFVTLVFRTGLRDTTHLWLAVVLLAVVIETYVSGELVRQHATISWYLGLGLALAWQSLFLIVQLYHANEQMAAFGAATRNLIEETVRDPLTGLFNRRGFDEKFEEQLALCRDAGAPIGLIALDLDYFKSYNDHFGHLAGDDALRRIGAAIAAVANRPQDACCRIGGEEFAVVLPFTDDSGARTVAERIRQAVLRLKIPHAPAVPIPTMTVSIGISVADGRFRTTTKFVYEAADQALYRAKRLGRNRIATAVDPPEPAGEARVS